MGYIPARLNRKSKAVWCSFSPGFKCTCFGQAIERVVDLDSFKLRAIVRKLFIVVNIFRIKSSFPVFIVPTRCANMNAAGFQERCAFNLLVINHNLFGDGVDEFLIIDPIHFPPAFKSADNAHVFIIQGNIQLMADPF